MSLGSGAPLVVECVGLPGAGKSTVEAYVVAALRARGLRCADRPSVGGQDVSGTRHYARLAGFFLAHPAELWASMRLARAGRGHAGFTGRESFRRVSVWAWRFALARRQGPDVLLLDQGLVQEGWSLTLRDGRHTDAVLAELGRLVGAARVPYALIAFELPPALAAERIAGRLTRESRFDRLPLEDVRRRLEHEAPRLRELTERAAAALQAPLLRIDAGRPPGHSATEIAGFVESLVRGTPPPEGRDR